MARPRPGGSGSAAGPQQPSPVAEAAALLLHTPVSGRSSWTSRAAAVQVQAQFRGDGVVGAKAGGGDDTVDGDRRLATVGVPHHHDHPAVGRGEGVHRETSTLARS
ncbi:hypothetical protein [Micromonospora orduensis]|uniref:hypothetical protein n=1 Tax=Micromonospora orduensis TaxID=1420891 RepID=UPI001ABF20E1